MNKLCEKILITYLQDSGVFSYWIVNSRRSKRRMIYRIRPYNSKSKRQPEFDLVIYVEKDGTAHIEDMKGQDLLKALEAKKPGSTAKYHKMRQNKVPRKSLEKIVVTNGDAYA